MPVCDHKTSTSQTDGPTHGQTDVVTACTGTLGF